jgi:CRP-like cAMP-binding protein
MTNASETLIAKLSLRDELSAEERQALESAPSQMKHFARGEEMVREGETPSFSTLLVQGWGARQKCLPDGRCQILSLHITGDFLDLHAFLLKVQDHSVVALTECTAALFPHQTLQTITEQHPHLARLLWTSTLIDSAILREWVLSTGRRTAAEHMANLACEMFLRLRSIGQVEGYVFEMPLTQSQLADVMGLSVVHTNRTLQELRSRGLVVWEGRRVEIPDWERLCEFAYFDPRYLHLERMPR